MSKLSKFLNKTLPGYKTHAAGALLIAAPFGLEHFGYSVAASDKLEMVLGGIAIMSGRAAVSGVKQHIEGLVVEALSKPKKPQA